jgi:hypothetical protein
MDVLEWQLAAARRGRSGAGAGARTSAGTALD